MQMFKDIFVRSKNFLGEFFRKLEMVKLGTNRGGPCGPNPSTSLFGSLLSILAFFAQSISNHLSVTRTGKSIYRRQSTSITKARRRLSSGSPWNPTLPQFSNSCFSVVRTPFQLVLVALEPAQGDEQILTNPISCNATNLQWVTIHIVATWPFFFGKQQRIWERFHC